MHEVRALCYLEWRYALHAITAIRRSPARAVLWVPYTLFLGFLVFSRAYQSRHGAGSTTGIAPNVATGVAGIYLAMTGAALGTAAAGRVATFRSSAEALLMCNAGLAPLSIALWLQLRRLVGSAWRAVGGFAYLFLLLAPRRGDFVATTGAFIAAMLLVAVPLTAELPAFLIARGRLQTPVRIVAWTVAAAGVAIGVLGFSGPRTWRTVLSVMRVDPGNIVAAVLANDGEAILLALTLLGGFVAIVAVLGGDALPELYAAAQGRFALQQRAKTGRGVDRARAIRGNGSEHAPTGALVLIWKDWLGFRRGSGITLWIGGSAFWAICGAAAAYEAVGLGNDAPLVTIFGATALFAIVWAPSTASNGLADDLAKPLFWLAHASLRARLAVWTLARTWRGATALTAAPVVAAVICGHALIAIEALPITLVAFWSLQALGIGLYAIFPSPLDARGPIALLRFLVSLAYIAPAALVAVITIVLQGGPLLAAFGFALALGAQGWVVIELCALRFAEYGASLGTLSRAL